MNDMDEADKKLFYDWKSNKLLLLINDFKSVMEEIKTMTIASFSKIVGIFTQSAYKSFAIALGVDDIISIPEKFCALLLSAVVSDFNSVLPKDFPYLVAAISGSSGRSEVKISCVRKDAIPGHYDIISKNIFTIIIIKNELPENIREIEKLSVERVSFLGGQELPESQ